MIEDRRCIKCGKLEGQTDADGVTTTFRSGLALKCKPCDTAYTQERREYETKYRRAVGRAQARLVKEYRLKYETYLGEERAKIDAEEG